MRHIVIVGAGAAGLMAAGTALSSGARVTLIEHNSRPARKVMITGKGRCNVTNNTDLEGLISAVTKNGRFLYSAFSTFSARDTMELFEGLGVPLKTERGNRVFPVSDKAVDIVDALAKFSKGAKVITAEAEGIIVEEGRAVGVKTDKGEISGDAVIIASGGASYPATGSRGAGYRFARELGHTVTELSGSLVPIEVHEGFAMRLQGLSLKNVTLSLYKEGARKSIFSELGEMLFTHFGVSGPLVLSASAHIRNLEKNKYWVSIDLKPALSAEKLDERILRDFGKFSNKNIGNALFELLPSKLISEILKLSGIEAHKKVNEVTKAERLKLGECIKNLKLRVTALRPIEEAIITSGGIKVGEVNPKTMESKIIKDLYFAGEILDVDAYTGGFNLQIAFSTGRLAGEAAANKFNVEE